MTHAPTFPVTETLQVDTLEVACDGGGGPLGHPRVFLHIKEDEGYVVCPYCSRKFVATEAAFAHAGH